MRTNRAGMDIIRESESLRLKAYYCPAGVLTIGYGHTGSDVHEGQEITEEQAEKLLSEDVEWAEEAVETLAPASLNSNQFSALVSFVFNIGAGKFQTSTLLRKLNAGDVQGAADEFPRWNKSRGRVLLGLTIRREAERTLFLTSPEARAQSFHGGGYGR